MDPGQTLPRHALLVTLALLLPMALAGCTTGPVENGTIPPEVPPNATPDPGQVPPQRPAPGDAIDTPVPTDLPPADPGTLMDLVEDQVYQGENATPRYRTPGSPGHAAAIPVLEAMLSDRGATVETQAFETELPGLGEVELTNVYGVRTGTLDREVWIAAHWDSRAWADAEPGQDPCTGEPVLGANDGAAGVAVVAHLLDVLPATNLTIRIALFDGEDQGGCGPGPGYGGGGWAVGSTYAVAQLNDTERERIHGLILVDMPGDENLEIRREGFSQSANPGFVDLIFHTAHALGASSFIDERGPPITDDHRGFLDAGIPAVDLIHLDCGPETSCHGNPRGPFPATHHTLNDTPEHLSGEKMAEVTEVVAATVLRLDASFGGQGS